MRKTRTLGGTANQADHAQIALLAQPRKAGLGDEQVLLVVVRENEDAAACWQIGHGSLNGIGVLGHHIGGQSGRKDRVPAVHPGDLQRQ